MKLFPTNPKVAFFLGAATVILLNVIILWLTG